MIHVLPDEIAETLNDASPGEDAASDAQVAAFIKQHTKATRPEILHGWIKALTGHIEDGRSRHSSAVSVVTGALKETRLGYFTARAALDALNPIFINAVALQPKPRIGKRADDEWDGIVAWSVGQALAADLAHVRARTEQKMPDNIEWVDRIGEAKTDTPPGDPPATEGIGHNGHYISDLKITTLADVEAERVEWLWRGRLPRGKLVVFDGDPELGKSTLALTFAAAITTEYKTEDAVMGGLWPDGERCEYSGDIIILSAEDGLADTVRPRLDAAGGDPAKVHSIDAAIVVDEKGELFERAITLADVDRLHRAIKYYDAKLVIVDVLMAYLPSDRDSHRDQDVRSIFAPLSRIAADTGCTILVLRHLNKGKGGNPLYRGGGSIAIVGAARVGLLVAKCPDDGDETLCAFAVQKNNLSAKPEALTYRIVECTNGAGKVQWVGTTDRPIRDLLADVERDPDGEVFDERDYTGDFKDSWLYKYLRDALDAKAQVRPKDAVAAGADKGISRRSVFRLFESLANAGMARSIDGTEFPRVTHWELIADGTTGPYTQTSGTTGTTGPDLYKQGGTTADLFEEAGTTAETVSEQVKQPDDSPVVPCSATDRGEPPPGGITTNTPGMTGRVAAALAKAAQQRADS